MLSNNSMQQLDEAGLQSPVGALQPVIASDGETDITQADIDAGIRRARVLRARAFHRWAAKLARLLGIRR